MYLNTNNHKTYLLEPNWKCCSKY